MTTATISIPVDQASADAYARASEDERRKLQLLLSLRLRELTTGPARPLREIMDDMGSRAEAQGLTPEILKSILDDE